jgi:hypothetical protein
LTLTTLAPAILAMIWTPVLMIVRTTAINRATTAHRIIGGGSSLTI